MDIRHVDVAASVHGEGASLDGVCLEATRDDDATLVHKSFPLRGPEWGLNGPLEIGIRTEYPAEPSCQLDNRLAIAWCTSQTVACL
jgi:hypothetical protein